MTRSSGPTGPTTPTTTAATTRRYYAGGRFYSGGFRVAPPIRRVPSTVWRGSPPAMAGTPSGGGWRGAPPAGPRPSGTGTPWRGTPPTANSTTGTWRAPAATPAVTPMRSTAPAPRSWGAPPGARELGRPPRPDAKLGSASRRRPDAKLGTSSLQRRRMAGPGAVGSVPGGAFGRRVLGAAGLAGWRRIPRPSPLTFDVLGGVAGDDVAARRQPEPDEARVGEPVQELVQRWLVAATSQADHPLGAEAVGAAGRKRG